MAGRVARRARPARRLERAGRRHLARDLRPARRARALPRPRRLGADRDPARRLGARPARRAAGVLAAPRRSSASRARRCSSLVVLYVVPVVAIGFGVEFLSGAVFTLLMVAFLRLEKLRRPDALGAAALAAGRDARRARRRARAQPRHAVVRLRDVGARDVVVEVDVVHAGTTAYGGLNWPRDGRELLRVRARQPAYWKAENLDEFDGRGVAPLAGPLRGRGAARRRPARRCERWTQRDQGLDPQPAHGPVHHRGLRVRARDPAAET